MTLHVDESYNLEIARGEVENGIGVRCVITAKTAFGARHGLETLSQLIAFDDIFSSFVIASNVQIMQDRPVFPYRGALIDMSRSFIPLDKLENVVRAMSYNKMNVLHLHISDTTSFPIEIKSQANVTFYGAYSEDKLIRRDQMIDFVKFANSMGVMILPEVDGPAHVGAGFEWGKDAGLGELVVCQDSNGSQKKWINSALEPASGQVNLVNENFYKVMGDVYDEIAEIFSLSDYFHIGGDEIVVGSDEADVSCYNHTEKAVDILAYLESAGYDRRDQESFYALWQNYTYRVASVVEKAFDRQSRPTKKLHIWGGGDIDSGGYSLLNRDDTTTVLPPSMYTIQVWDLSTGSIVPKLIQKGYDVVLSNTDYAYLDCGAAGFTQPGGYWCQPYHEWQHLYEYLADVSNLWGLGADQMTHVLGSETLLWSELIDTNNLEQKMWPRTAALAEALWGRTNTDHSSSWYNADPRMQHWRSVLLQRGIQAEPLQTYWCQQRGAHACTVDTGIPQ